MLVLLVRPTVTAAATSGGLSASCTQSELPGVLRRQHHPVLVINRINRHADPDLAQVIQAASARGLFFCRRQRRRQQRRQYGDDRTDHQQFDEGDAAAATSSQRESRRRVLSQTGLTNTVKAPARFMNSLCGGSRKLPNPMPKHHASIGEAVRAPKAWAPFLPL